MTRTLFLTFDGKVFRPEEPVELEPDTRVWATIETAEHVGDKRGTFLETAKSLNLDGPPDWSSRLKEYLYGVPENAG